MLLTLATRVLEDHGYTVLVGANGPDALHVVERHGGVIHLLVTDADIHFLQKPFLPSTLVRKIREVLDAPPK